MNVNSDALSPLANPPLHIYASTLFNFSPLTSALFLLFPAFKVLSLLSSTVPTQATGEPIFSPHHTWSDLSTPRPCSAGLVMSHHGPLAGAHWPAWGNYWQLQPSPAACPAPLGKQSRGPPCQSKPKGCRLCLLSPLGQTVLPQWLQSLWSWCSPAFHFWPCEDQQ